MSAPATGKRSTHTHTPTDPLVNQKLQHYKVCVHLLQRLESRLSLLQGAVDEYNKAKNEFAAKVKKKKKKKV